MRKVAISPSSWEFINKFAMCWITALAVVLVSTLPPRTKDARFVGPAQFGVANFSRLDSDQSGAIERTELWFDVYDPKWQDDELASVVELREGFEELSHFVGSRSVQCTTSAWGLPVIPKLRRSNRGHQIPKILPREGIYLITQEDLRAYLMRPETTNQEFLETPVISAAR
jgi:hypothetical protein